LKNINTDINFCASSTSCATCAKAGTCDWNGVNKLSVFDFLSQIPPSDGGGPFPFAEVRFKNTRKEFYYTGGNNYYVGQPVIVESDHGYDLGLISASGETARFQMQSKNLSQDPEQFKKILRPANQREIDLWHQFRSKEEETKMKVREIAKQLGLEMKVSDTEYQADGKKVTIYYTAPERVDFRELIKLLAKELSTRIEMRQIGYRQEAARLGGIGSCGRELCCSTWLTDFRSVTTQAAKYQQLSLNPSKLTGQCGKLKCCLNFELDSYVEALEDFPSSETILKTEKGDAKSIKIDVFKGFIWYVYKDLDEHMIYKLNLQQANEIIRMNENDITAPPLEFYADELKFNLEEEKIKTVSFDAENSITRFDEPKKEKPGKKRNRKKQKRKKPVVKKKNTASATNNKSKKNNGSPKKNNKK